MVDKKCNLAPLGKVLHMEIWETIQGNGECGMYGDVLPTKLNLAHKCSKDISFAFEVQFIFVWGPMFLLWHL